MTTLTSAQRRARAAEIIAESERSGCGTLEAIRRVAPKYRRGARVTETTPARLAAGKPKGAKKAARRAREAQRIARVVTEALTAAQAPSLPPGVTAPAKPKAAAKAPARAPHEMTDDELAAATVSSVGGASPFWRPRESAPSAPIRESAAGSAATAADLAKLSDEGLTRVYDRVEQARGRHASPIWAA